MIVHQAMRNLCIVVVCLISFANGYGQSQTNVYGKIDVEITKKSRMKVCARVHIRSVFPGGDSAWVLSIETKLNQSTTLAKGARKGNYLVTVQFIVDKDSSIRDVRPLTSNGYGMEAEVLREVKKKSGWLPSSRGYSVRAFRPSSSTAPVKKD